MKNILLILLTISIIASCQNQATESSKKLVISEVPENYLGAFDTFYKYISALNKNELTENIMSQFFNENLLDLISDQIFLGFGFLHIFGLCRFCHDFSPSMIFV